MINNCYFLTCLWMGVTAFGFPVKLLLQVTCFLAIDALTDGFFVCNFTRFYGMCCMVMQAWS